MDIDKKIGYVLENGVYQEIAVKDMVENGAWKPEYRDRYLVKLHGYLMEVSEQAYKDFQRQRRREKYLAEQAQKYHVVSYNEYDCYEYSGEDLLADILTNVEDEAIHRIIAEQIAKAVDSLPREEYELIHALFYDGVSELEYCARMGIPRMTINCRKRVILLKIKTICKL